MRYEIKVLDLINHNYLDDNVVSFSFVSKSDIKPGIIHDVVRWQMANSRLGTKAVKNRAQVKATGRKPHKQKGTGRARKGSRVSGGQRGGGVIHDVRTVFTTHLNKKVRKIGLKHVISNRFFNEGLVVIASTDKDLEKFPNKTARLARLLTCFKGDRLLFVLPNNVHNEKLEDFIRAGRGLPNVNFIKTCGLNVYDILKNDKLIVLNSAVSELEERICNI
ncbi:MAG: 50S ribosomal protein L4 [Pseudomonadota bacterium]